jgi:hypothetical protein
MDTVWLTYHELADRLGIGLESARTLVKRKRWPRQKGNNGLARIEVPLEHLAARPASPGRSPDHDLDRSPERPPGQDPDRVSDHDPTAVAVLSRTMQRLESQLERALAKAGRVDVLEALLVERDRRIADLEADRDRWHAAATVRRRWWPWRSSA